MEKGVERFGSEAGSGHGEKRFWRAGHENRPARADRERDTAPSRDGRDAGGRDGERRQSGGRSDSRKGHIWPGHIRYRHNDNPHRDSRLCADCPAGKRSGSEERNGIEIIYGRHPVNELMHSGRPVQRLHVLAGAQGIPKDIFVIARERAIPVVHTDRARLDYLTHRANHQGVVAEAGGGAFADLEQVLGIPESRGETPLFLVLDGVQDPGNFGAILRSAEAAGVHGVFTPGDNSCGLTGTVSKASAGADQYIPVVRVAKLGALLRRLRDLGCALVGTEAEGALLYTESDLRQPAAIVMGAEESGLHPSVRALCT